MFSCCIVPRESGEFDPIRPRINDRIDELESVAMSTASKLIIIPPTWRGLWPRRSLSPLPSPFSPDHPCITDPPPFFLSPFSLFLSFLYHVPSKHNGGCWLRRGDTDPGSGRCSTFFKNPERSILGEFGSVLIIVLVFVLVLAVFAVFAVVPDLADLTDLPSLTVCCSFVEYTVSSLYFATNEFHSTRSFPQSNH